MIRKQHGMTLAEFMVAVSVSAAILLTGFSVRGWFLTKEATIESRSVVAELSEAMQGFYRTHCRDALFPAVSVATLIAEGYLPATYTASIEWGSNLQPAISPALIPPRLTISSVANAGQDAAWVASQLGAHSVVGSTVTWQYTPDDADYYLETNMDRFRAYYGTSC